MGLRRDFLIHKRKTVESFTFVKADISSINLNIEHIKNVLASIESRISGIENDASSLRVSIEKCSSDINLQKNNSLILWSRIENIDKSIGSAVATVYSFKDKIDGIISKNQQMSSSISKNNESIKNISLRLSKQSLATRKLNSALRLSQKENQKLKNLLNKKLKTVKRADSELEKRLKSQKARIVKLNRKIEGKKVARRTSRLSIGKVKKKTAPKRKIRKAAKKATQRKKLVEIITTKKSLI